MMKLLKQLLVLLILLLVCAAVFSRCGARDSNNELNSPNDSDQTELEALVLVNRWQPLSDSYEVDLIALHNGQSVDRLCYEALTEMLNACQNAGLEPVVCSGYRTVETQTQLYENKIERLIEQGFSRRDAENVACTEVAYPGTSEHHTGLAVDIVDVNNQNLDESQEYTAVQQWLLSHCWEYGFVLRYPNGKSDITGIIYEPWHYRYVGKDAAMAMYNQNLCLEEYLAFY